VLLTRVIANQLVGDTCELLISPLDVFLPASPDQDEDDVDTVVQPDLLVTCDPAKDIPKGVWGAPDWVIEILSPYTGKKDLNEKFALYEKHWVFEYWVVDPGNRWVHIYRPGADGHFHMGLPALAMLASSFLLALTITGMKVLTRDHSPMVLLVWSAALGLVLAIPGALFVWRWPQPMDLALLALMGVMGTITQGCYIKGMQIGDAGAMAPIDYVRLVFSTAAGFFLFNEIPNGWTIAGAGIVVASTLFITWREQQISKAARLATAPDA